MKRARQTCKHCSHTWTPRKDKPKKCPHCGRTNWRLDEEKPLRVPGDDSSVFPGLF